MKISVIIPTYNAERYLANLLVKLKEQSIKNYEIIIIDSTSQDNTLEIAESFKIKLLSIEKEKFDHGGTRTIAGKESKGDIIIYITQDVIPYNQSSFENITKPFLIDSKIGAVYGRQIPHPDANPFSAHSRLFIYPENSFTRTIGDKNLYKIKTAFLSNAFTAYSRKVLNEIGWFKENLISTEDTYAGAKILLAGYKLRYSAEAVVYHSHNYNMVQEFKRYFDIGSFHKTEEWIIKEFGKADNEGLRFFKSELSYLIKNKKYICIPEFFLRIMLKYIGYILGQSYKILPGWLIKKFSMHCGWWDKNRLNKKRE